MHSDPPTLLCVGSWRDFKCRPGVGSQDLHTWKIFLRDSNRIRPRNATLKWSLKANFLTPVLTILFTLYFHKLSMLRTCPLLSLALQTRKHWFVLQYRKPSLLSQFCWKAAYSSMDSFCTNSLNKNVCTPCSVHSIIARGTFSPELLLIVCMPLIFTRFYNSWRQVIPYVLLIPSQYSTRRLTMEISLKCLLNGQIHWSSYMCYVSWNTTSVPSEQQNPQLWFRRASFATVQWCLSRKFESRHGDHIYTTETGKGYNSGPIFVFFEMNYQTTTANNQHSHRNPVCGHRLQSNRTSSLSNLESHFS